MYSMYIRLCFKSFRKLLLTVVNQYKDLIRILHLRIVGWLRQTNNANTACLSSTRVTKYVYIKSTTVYVPSSELGLSHSLSRQRVCPSPQDRGRGAHSPAAEGLGESQFRWLEKKLSILPTLWPEGFMEPMFCYNPKKLLKKKLTTQIFFYTMTVLFSSPEKGRKKGTT